jgi:hypothetical protein
VTAEIDKNRGGVICAIVWVAGQKHKLLVAIKEATADTGVQTLPRSSNE